MHDYCIAFLFLFSGPRTATHAVLNNTTMRSILAISTLIAGIILFSAHLSFSDKSSKAVFVFSNGGELRLPAQPFDYQPEPFPSYFVNGSVGYNSGIDTISLIDITNDGATLGRVLFYDELLSANNNISCATCHQQAFSFADNVPLSMGVEENSASHTPHLNDLGWSNKDFFTWNMGESNLMDAISIPLKHPNEIGASDMEVLISKLSETDYYPELFAAAFEDSAITEDNIKQALTQFISSMTTLDTHFDRVLQLKEIFPSSLEGVGQNLFNQSCRSCHINGNFLPSNLQVSTEFFLEVNGSRFTNGLPLEPEDMGAGNLDEKFNGLFKVLTLRNIANTAPYMHDGRFETLEEVVEHYSDGVTNEHTDLWSEFIPEAGFQFSQFEKLSLVAFMKTFTDDRFLKDIRFSDPFEYPEEEEYEPYVYADPIRAFPNPTNGPLNLSFDNSNQRNIEIHVMNINGQLLRQLSSHKNGVYTDISDWPAGIYLVRMIDGDKEIKEVRIVKQ